MREELLAAKTQEAAAAAVEAKAEKQAAQQAKADAKAAKEAYKSGETIRAYVLRNKLVDSKALDRLLDPTAMTKPGGKGPGGG